MPSENRAHAGDPSLLIQKQELATLNISVIVTHFHSSAVCTIKTTLYGEEKKKIIPEVTFTAKYLKP